MALRSECRLQKNYWFQLALLLLYHLLQGCKSEAVCYDKNGGARKLGAQWVDGDYWRECLQTARGVAGRYRGCVSPEGGLIGNGEQFERSGFLHRCIVKDLETCVDGSAETVIVGCVSDSGQKAMVGDTFIFGSGEQTFRRGCVRRSDGSVYQPNQSCRYKGPRVTVEVKVGCYAPVENEEYFACWHPDSAGGIVQTSFEPKLANVASLRTGGDCLVAFWRSR